MKYSGRILSVPHKIRVADPYFAKSKFHFRRKHHIAKQYITRHSRISLFTK